MADPLTDLYIRLRLDKDPLVVDASAAAQALDNLAKRGGASIQALVGNFKQAGAALASGQVGGKGGGGGGSNPLESRDTSVISSAAAQLNSLASGSANAMAKVIALEHAMSTGGAQRYGASLAQATLAQEKFNKAVQFEELAARYGRLGASLYQFGQAATVPFVVASAAIGGWVRAGLSGTTMGERLGLQFQLLSREVASLFIPVLEKVIGVVQRVTDWFRSLSGSQQAMIGNVIAIGIGLLGVATILPRLISGFQSLSLIFTVLSANPFVLIVGAIVALIGHTVGWGNALAVVGKVLGTIGSILGKVIDGAKTLLGAVADVGKSLLEKVGGALEKIDQELTGGKIKGFFAGLFENFNRGLEVLNGESNQREGQNRHELANTTRGPESLAASFSRFQTAALRTGAGREPPTELQVGQVIQLLQTLTGQGAEPVPAPVS